jgi:hypothetical protein
LRQIQFASPSQIFGQRFQNVPEYTAVNPILESPVAGLV